MYGSIVSGKILIDRFHSMFPSKSAVYTQLSFDIGENSFQPIVCVRKSNAWIIIESPKQRQIPSDIQICAA